MKTNLSSTNQPFLATTNLSSTDQPFFHRPTFLPPTNLSSTDQPCMPTNNNRLPATNLSSSNQPFLAATLSCLSSRAYPDFYFTAVTDDHACGSLGENHT